MATIKINSYFSGKGYVLFPLFGFLIPFTLWSRILYDIVFLKLLETMQFFALF